MTSSPYSQEQLKQALERCASEPIHQIAQIQPQGALLVMTADADRTILQASANLAEFLDLSVDEVHAKRLVAVLGEEPAGKVERLLAKLGPGRVATGVLSLIRQQSLQKLHARVFITDDVCVLELTRDDESHLADQLNDLLLPIQQALLHAETEYDATHYMNLITAMVQSLFGFDRVMVCQFDSNWDGEVIAERLNTGITSYLGNHFPASDIPPQARQLYTSNLVRLVVDIEAEPVAILPALNPVTRQPLDMTHSSLRSFSPIHIEYLRNMGVQASMSISLLQNGRLWGLIACHHVTPKSISNALQEGATLISQMASAKLSVLESQEQHRLGTKVSEIISLLLQYITTDSEAIILQKLSQKLLNLMDASGLIIIVEGKPYGLGEVPDQVAVDALLSWLATQPPDDSFACDNLSQQFPPAKAYASVASGILVSPLTREMQNGIIWLRQEKLRFIHWVGNPEKTINTDSDGRLSLSPRKSFNTWMDEWIGRSNSWSFAETEAAIILSRAISKGMIQKSWLEKEIIERKQLERAFVSVAEDRQRSIGQELHDNLGQHIAAIGYQARAAVKNLLAEQHFKATEIVDAIAKQAQVSVIQCKQLAHSLLPLELEANGLVEALKLFASGISTTYGVDCRFLCDDHLIIDDAALALNLYRIVQEAVNNALRHGHAQHLEISLVIRHGKIQLSVTDDGCGIAAIEKIKDSSGGMGIKIMQYRAKQQGAILEFLPRATGGTEVRVEMPST